MKDKLIEIQAQLNHVLNRLDEAVHDINMEGMYNQGRIVDKAINQIEEACYQLGEAINPDGI